MSAQPDSTHAQTETRRLLANWQRYRLDDGSFGALSPYPAYRLEQRGPRAESVMPTMLGDAVDADRVIRTMDRAQQHVLELLYLTRLPDHACAKRAACSVRTWYRRVEAAREAFWSAWQAWKTWQAAAKARQNEAARQIAHAAGA